MCCWSPQRFSRFSLPPTRQRLFRAPEVWRFLKTPAYSYHKSYSACPKRDDTVFRFSVSPSTGKNDSNTSLRVEHPRRSRGSQSGPEKRRDESFQVRAKEPLGTDSHRTIYKNSRARRLLFGHKKRFVLLCLIGKQFLHSWVIFVSSYTTAIVPLHLPGSFTKLVCARKTFIFYFPNEKRRNYRWVDKTFGVLSAGAIQFAPRIFCFWRITMYRK